ncbi:MAG: glycosyltransferase [bacterium]|nr:glycosyltransferase [bacterium]
MNVLMLTNRAGADARGGAERIVAQLAVALEERGHTVTVRARTTSGFASLHRMPTVVRVLWHAMDVWNIAAAWSLARAIRRIAPDVIHTHNLVGCGGFTPRVIRRSGVRWVHTLHDVQLITPSGLLDRHGQPYTAIERSRAGRWFRALRRRRFGSPDVVTSPTQWLLALHRDLGFFPESQSTVIGNPVSDSSEPLVAHARDRAVRTLLFVGQVEGHKGVVLLLEAFRQLVALFPDVALHVVGDGSVLPLLKHASRSMRNVVLRGRLDAAAVRRAIAHVDVVVVPSVCAENQPGVILEAFATGIPVVASNVGGISELVEDGVHGWLIDPGSVDELIRALRHCIEAPQAVRAMREACVERAGEHRIAVIAQMFDAVYTHAEGNDMPSRYR